MGHIRADACHTPASELAHELALGAPDLETATRTERRIDGVGMAGCPALGLVVGVGVHPGVGTTLEVVLAERGARPHADDVFALCLHAIGESAETGRVLAMGLHLEAASHHCQHQLAPAGTIETLGQSEIRAGRAGKPIHGLAEEHFGVADVPVSQKELGLSVRRGK